MQIHELDAYIGTLSNSDYFVVDDGTETFKIPATNFVSVINAYPRAGQTPLTSGWLSETDGGTALTPAEDKIYILMADSSPYTANTMFRWNSTAYEPLTSGGSGTSVPTADTVAEFDSTAHMNSTDMTAQEVDDFVDGLNPSGFDVVTNVTNRVTFLKSVSTDYTHFYKVGAVIFYQIQFTENIASGTTVATIDSSLATSKQFWALAGYSNGGSAYKRVSVSGAEIKVVGAISAYDFVSGFFIPNAV